MNHNTESKKDYAGQRRARWEKRPDIKRSSDTQLAAAAIEAIECLTTVPLDSIKIVTRNGWLHLEGTLYWESQRTTVEDVTRHLPGVLGITDTIAIKPCVPWHMESRTVL